MNAKLSDRTNQEWLTDLSAPDNEESLEDLRAVLSKGLFYALVNRVHTDHLDDLIQDFTQDSLLRVLENLDSFRGESKFITWATKIAVRVAFSELRRKRWKDVSIETLVPENFNADPDSVSNHLVDTGDLPEEQTAQSMLILTIDRLIHEKLTEKQRRVLLGSLNDDLSIEDLATQMGTNRNALYKMLHDARRKLLGLLLAAGYTSEDLLLKSQE